MKKLSFFTILVSAILFIACGGENGPETTSKLKVSVTEGVADVSSLTFTVTSENAEYCRWTCVEEGNALPSAEDVLQKGKNTYANTSTEVTATDLKDNTTYVIIAAAMAGEEMIASAPIRMTTLVKPAEPKAEISGGSVEADTYTFTITPSDAQKCAYKVYAKNETATADDVLSSGTEVSATEATTVTLENLEDGEYFVVAAAQNGDIKSLSSKVTFIINTALPDYTINPTKVYRQGTYNNGKEHLLHFNFIDNVGTTAHLALDFIIPSANDYVPAGTYEFGGEASFRLDPEYTRLDIDADHLYGGSEFISGSVSVVIKDGTYTFDVNLTRKTDEYQYSGHVIKMKYVGAVEDMPIV